MLLHNLGISSFQLQCPFFVVFGLFNYLFWLDIVCHKLHLVHPRSFCFSSICQQCSFHKISSEIYIFFVSLPYWFVKVLIFGTMSSHVIMKCGSFQLVSWCHLWFLKKIITYISFDVLIKLQQAPPAPGSLLTHNFNLTTPIAALVPQLQHIYHCGQKQQVHEPFTHLLSHSWKL